MELSDNLREFSKEEKSSSPAKASQSVASTVVFIYLLVCKMDAQYKLLQDLGHVLPNNWHQEGNSVVYNCCQASLQEQQLCEFYITRV